MALPPKNPTSVGTNSLHIVWNDDEFKVHVDQEILDENNDSFYRPAPDYDAFDSLPEAEQEAATLLANYIREKAEDDYLPPARITAIRGARVPAR